MEIQSGTWGDLLEYAAASDIGMRRGNNQDSFVVSLAGNEGQWRRRGHLLVVADGMGAHAAGELASQMAVDNLPLIYNKLTQLPPPDALRQSVLESNHLIHAKGEGTVGFRGMGTTCCALVFLPDQAIIGHVGDSRIYRLRGDTLEQLTFDHSLVWELAEAGQIGESDVPHFVPKNVITRSLGPHHAVDVDLEGPIRLQDGDTFLLCSDGLTGPVGDVEIGTILKCLAPDDAIRTLIDIANLRGGPDNITVIVARIQRQTASSPKSDDGVSDTVDLHPKAVHPALLAVALVLMVIAIGFAVYAKWAAAAISCVGLALVGVIALILKSTRSEPAVQIEKQLGRGPYRSFDCSVNSSVVDSLIELTEELREVASNPGWDIDLAPFEAGCNEAKSAAASGDAKKAVRKYCEAIRGMMRQVREQQAFNTSDSDILS